MDLLTTVGLLSFSVCCLFLIISFIRTFVNEHNKETEYNRLSKKYNDGLMSAHVARENLKNEWKVEDMEQATWIGASGSPMDDDLLPMLKYARQANAEMRKAKNKNDTCRWCGSYKNERGKCKHCGGE